MGKRGRKNRRNFTAEQKATILRRHLVDKVAVSEGRSKGVGTVTKVYED